MYDKSVAEEFILVISGSGDALLELETAAPTSSLFSPSAFFCSAASFILVGMALGSTASQPLWGWMAGRYNLVVTLRASAITLIVGSALFFFLASNGAYTSGLASALVGAGSGGAGSS